MDKNLLNLHLGEAILLKDITIMPFDKFSSSIMAQTDKGARVVSFWGVPNKNGTIDLFALLAHNKDGYLELASSNVKDVYPSLTPQLPQVHQFEREIFEQWNIRPDGHPWLKPIRFQTPKSSGSGQRDTLPSVTNFLKIHGEEIHEVAVGPVHAGIIEPGHFRFQCHGEDVFHLEISLGYQHRGVEHALIGGINKRTIHYVETLAGDTTIGHTLAYCQGVEALSKCNVPLRALVLRGIMLELERLANHTGDLGALANDIGYLPTASYCGRLRGDFLNMTALISGNRFGRNMLRPGGVMFDIDEKMADELIKRLKKTFQDVKNAVTLLWESSLVMDRFDETGIITKKTAEDLGLVGVAARACGIEQDVRFDFPTGIFQFSQIPISMYSSGDVFARAFVRWLEIQKSVEFIREQLQNMPKGGIFHPIAKIGGQKMAVSLIEGWRGEIFHAISTDENGNISNYKITDPSFHNWIGLAMALRGEEISNFPLCNKSFNLSYCGHDL